MPFCILTVTIRENKVSTIKKKKSSYLRKAILMKIFKNVNKKRFDYIKVFSF